METIWNIYRDAKNNNLVYFEFGDIKPIIKLLDLYQNTLVQIVCLKIA